MEIKVKVFENAEVRLEKTFQATTQTLYKEVLLQAMHLLPLPFQKVVSLSNTYTEILLDDDKLLPVTPTDTVHSKAKELHIQTALCKKMVFRVSGPKTQSVLAQVLSKLATSLSSLDNLQQLIGAPHGKQAAVIFAQFLKPKRMAIMESLVSFYYKAVTVQRATTKTASDVLKSKFSISHNLSDGERDHINAALDGSMPLCDQLDTAVVLTEREQFVMKAGHALTCYECKACNILHNTPCMSCSKKPTCNYDKASKLKFRNWSLSDDAFICVGCGHTVCELCKTFFNHSCQVMPKVYNDLNYRFTATVALHLFEPGKDPLHIERPAWFLKCHLPDCGFDGLELRQVKIAMSAMTSFSKFRAEAEYILREPGQWTIGLDSTNDSQVFLAAYAIDKRFVKLADVLHSRINKSGVDRFYKSSLESLNARKPPYTFP